MQDNASFNRNAVIWNVVEHKNLHLRIDSIRKTNIKFYMIKNSFYSTERKGRYGYLCS